MTEWRAGCLRYSLWIPDNCGIGVEAGKREFDIRGEDHDDEAVVSFHGEDFLEGHSSYCHAGNNVVEKNLKLVELILVRDWFCYYL